MVAGWPLVNSAARPSQRVAHPNASMERQPYTAPHIDPKDKFENQIILLTVSIYSFPLTSK